MLGLVLLVAATGKNSFVGPTLIGIVIALFAFAGFYFVQRLGVFRFLASIISRLAGSSDWQSLVQGGDTLDRTVRSLYARRAGVFGCSAWTMASLVLGSGEIWLALWFLDLPASFLNALILQSMVLTIRSAAFVVPAGLGVQEGGYLLVGSLLGISGDGAFALSLVWRAREIGLGIPAVIVWQVIEARDGKSDPEVSPFAVLFSPGWRNWFERPTRSRPCRSAATTGVTIARLQAHYRMHSGTPE